MRSHFSLFLSPLLVSSSTCFLDLLAKLVARLPVKLLLLPSYRAKLRMAGDAGKAGEDADPGKATSKLLTKAAVAAGEGILGRNAETVLTSQ